MNDKLDELHYIYKMIGNYGFCTVQELLDKYNKQLDNWNKLKEHFSFLKINSTGGNKEFIEDIILFMQELEQGSDNQ